MRVSGEQCGCQHSVACHENQRDAVDAGEGSQARQQQIIHLRIAKLIPRHTGDAGGGKFERDPEEGSKRQHRSIAAEVLSQEGQPQPEDTEVEAQHQAIEEQDATGSDGGDTAIGVHRGEDPVAVEQVPEDAAYVGANKASFQEFRMLAIFRAQQREKQMVRARSRPRRFARPATDPRSEREDRAGRRRRLP